MVSTMSPCCFLRAMHTSRSSLYCHVFIFSNKLFVSVQSIACTNCSVARLAPTAMCLDSHQLLCVGS